VLWGSFNLIVGYVLCRAGRFNVTRTRDAVIVGAGVIVTGVMLANAFGQLYSK
jgi:hypothetical protein